MDRLPTLQSELKNRLADGLDIALKYLAEAIADGSPKFDIFIQLKSRYSAYLSAIMVGGSSVTELEKVYNNLTAAFLLLVNSLTVNDLKPFEPSAAPAKPKRGELLYHIPHAMQENHETACRVRVAYLLETLFEDWKFQKEDQQRSIRVAEIMAVEMLNVAENQPFAIRGMTETIQFLEVGDFTEWLFYVRPLRLGEFPLLLKVSVIEVINGREVKKDVVIEEHVIVSGEAVEEKEVLKKTGVEVSFQTVENQPILPGFQIPKPSGIYRPDFPDFETATAKPSSSPNYSPQPSAVLLPNIQSSKSRKGLRAAALFLAFLMVSTVATFASTTKYERGFWVARIQNSEKAYTEFIEKFENDPKFAAAPQREKAYFKRAEISENPLVVRDYLENVDAKLALPANRDSVLEKLKILEIKEVASIAAAPTAEKIEKYTRNFPEMSRLPEVVDIVEKHPAIKSTALPILENAAVRQIQKLSVEPEKVKMYREVLPASEPIKRELDKQPELQKRVLQESGSTEIEKENGLVTEQVLDEKTARKEAGKPVQIDENQKVEDKPVQYSWTKKDEKETNAQSLGIQSAKKNLTDNDCPIIIENKKINGIQFVRTDSRLIIMRGNYSYTITFFNDKSRIFAQIISTGSFGLNLDDQVVFINSSGQEKTFKFVNIGLYEKMKNRNNLQIDREGLKWMANSTIVGVNFINFVDKMKYKYTILPKRGAELRNMVNCFDNILEERQ